MSTEREPTATDPSRTGRSRGQYAKTEEKRAAVLDAALEVFAESGFRGGFLRDIAQRAGMSEAGLLYYYPSKTSLLAAVLKRRDVESHEIAHLMALAGEESVRALVEHARSNAAAPAVVELYCILSAEATSADHPAHDYFTARYARTHDYLVCTFRQLEQEGRLADGVTPESAARATTAFLDGIQVQWLYQKDAVDMAGELLVFFRRITTLHL